MENIMRFIICGRYKRLEHCLILLIPIFIFLLFSSDNVIANLTTIVQNYRTNVVKLNVEFDEYNINGFGIIISKINDTIYCITANHIVRSNRAKPKNIFATFYSYQEKTFQALLLNKFDKNLDLAIIRINTEKDREKIRYNKNISLATPSTNEEVCFIGREGTWYIPTFKGTGSINRIDEITNRIFIDIMTVQPGTSGAPIFTKKGIIGMIVHDSVNTIHVTPINLIKQRIFKWNLPFDLKNLPMNKKNKNEVQIEKIDNGYIIKICTEFNKLESSANRLAQAKNIVLKNAKITIKKLLSEKQHNFPVKIINSIINNKEVVDVDISEDNLCIVYKIIIN